MKRWKIKLLYAVGILICLLEIRFHTVQSMLDRVAVWRVKSLAQEVHKEYETTWLGVEMLQYPGDLLDYATIVHRIKPDVIVEAGTYAGGLTTYLAMVLEQANPKGVVVTIDLYSNGWDALVRSQTFSTSLLQRIVFLQGDSGSREIYEKVAKYARGKVVMVILDSLHTSSHVYKELNLYSEFVSSGSYLIVNDTREEAMSLFPGNEGPLAAVRQFLRENQNFSSDPSFPRNYISCAPMGFLKRL